MAAICRSTIIKERTPLKSEWALRSLRNDHAVYVGIGTPLISEWLRRSAGIASRLPLKVPKTFDNFDFSCIIGKNIDKLRNLSTLFALYAHKTLAFIGKTGTGKTHLAQAIGRACCEHGMKAYFIKMTELRDRMTDARHAGCESTLLAALVRPSYLIY